MFDYTPGYTDQSLKTGNALIHTLKDCSGTLPLDGFANGTMHVNSEGRTVDFNWLHEATATNDSALLVRVTFSHDKNRKQYDTMVTFSEEANGFVRTVFNPNSVLMPILADRAPIARFGVKSFASYITDVLTAIVEQRSPAFSHLARFEEALEELKLYRAPVMASAA